MPTVIDEVSYSLDKELPACKGLRYSFRLGVYITDSFGCRLDACQRIRRNDSYRCYRG